MIRRLVFLLALAPLAGFAAQPAYVSRLAEIQNQIVRSLLAGQIDDYISCTLPLSGQPGPSTLAEALANLQARGIPIDAQAFTTDLALETPGPAGIAAAVQKALPESNAAQAHRAAQALTAALAANLAPDDVACSMTLLPWQIAADSFGRHVADQFVAFQVIVRNLNPSNQFLLHNVSLAVSGGAFHSGIDKMLVRNTQSHGQAYDRRNLAFRILEAAAGIAAGAATYGTRDFQDGAGLFQALAVPAFNSTFPDRYASQINSLNDLAFSSAAAYSMVVPPKGSAPFVTFLPSAFLTGKTAYKKWSAAELQSLLDSSYVIVAGVHIQEIHSALDNAALSPHH